MSQDHEREDERTWPEYRRLVLSELERIDRSLGTLNEKIDKSFDDRDDRMRSAEVNIAMLQIKCGLWGGLSGGLISIIMAVAKHQL